MLYENQHPDSKSIMISVLGVPNVGKSSLVNTLLGMELSIVTPLAQTTRNKISCILKIDHTEIILVDTPGLHQSSKEFNKRLLEQAREGTDGVDLNLVLIDLTKDLFPQVESVLHGLEKELGPTWIVFTKSDCFTDVASLPLEQFFKMIQELIPQVERFFTISSKTGDNIHLLTGAICDRATPGPHFYPGGEISNRNERFFVAEFIRKQAFELLKEELPYEVAVVIEEFKEFKKDEGDRISHISASILVNRPGQRAIVVGSKGKMIKEIGVRARKKIQALMGGQVHLNLHVKVSPRWYKNNFVLEEIGLPRAVNSARVWHKRGRV